MSRFYAELHDRELILQAATILMEVQRRNLIEVFLPVGDRTAEEAASSTPFPRRLASVAAGNGKLALVVEEDFFAGQARAHGGAT